ncbi:MAG: PAS domain-containing protein [Chloroflexi bacterium]|nr:PAS domain-containing protein [Chloroflexota bacterium]
MEKELIDKSGWIEQAVNASKDCYATLFDCAPVMMHSINREGELVNVNRRWLEKLGYQKGQVLGRKSLDFLTPLSREIAINDTLPTFWSTGHVEGVGYQFIKSDGKVIDILLDAELRPKLFGQLRTLAALRDPNDTRERYWASSTLRVLQMFTDVGCELESMHPSALWNSHNKQDAPLIPSERGDHQAELTREFVSAILEYSRDLTVNMRGILRAQEEQAVKSEDQFSEMLTVAKNIDHSLADLADSMATGRWRS